MPKMPKKTRNYTIRYDRSSIRSQSFRKARIVHCCRAAQESPTKLPHVWYMDYYTLFKGYYCPIHADEMTTNSFKTKKELIAHLAMKKLLGLKDEDPPF